MHEGELRSRRLPQHVAACGKDSVDELGVPGRPVPGKSGRAHLGRQVGRVEDVLHSDRNAVQWQLRLSGYALGVEGGRDSKCPALVETGPGLDGRLARADPCQVPLAVRARRKRAVGERPHRRPQIAGNLNN